MFIADPFIKRPVASSLLAVGIVLLGLLGRALPVATDTLAILQRMMITGVVFNLILAMFNLLPIPPLDGSHVMKYLLPPSWAIRYQQVGMYGVFILMILMMTRVGAPLLSAWMTPVNLLGGVMLRAISQFVLPSQFTLGM